MENFIKIKFYISRKLENVIHPITVEKNRIGNKFSHPEKHGVQKSFSTLFQGTDNHNFIQIIPRISSWKVFQTSYKAHITSLQTIDERK